MQNIKSGPYDEDLSDDEDVRGLETALLAETLLALAHPVRELIIVKDEEDQEELMDAKDEMQEEAIEEAHQDAGDAGHPRGDEDHSSAKEWEQVEDMETAACSSSTAMPLPNAMTRSKLSRTPKKAAPKKAEIHGRQVQRSIDPNKRSDARRQYEEGGLEVPAKYAKREPTPANPNKQNEIVHIKYGPFGNRISEPKPKSVPPKASDYRLPPPPPPPPPAPPPAAAAAETVVAAAAGAASAQVQHDCWIPQGQLMAPESAVHPIVAGAQPQMIPMQPQMIQSMMVQTQMGPTLVHPQLIVHPQMYQSQILPMMVQPQLIQAQTVAAHAQAVIGPAAQQPAQHSGPTHWEECSVTRSVVVNGPTTESAATPPWRRADR